MDLEIIRLSQKEKDKYHIISFVCGNLKYDTNELICETETDTGTENRPVVRGRGLRECRIGSLGLADAIFFVAGEGNGNPLQCSCLENPRDRGARWAAVYGVAQSRT